MPKRAVLLVLLVLLACAPAASATDDPFSFGRLSNSRADLLRRIGIHVNCLSASGCKLELILKTTGAQPVELGRVYTQLLGSTSEVNYVVLTKRKAAVLAKRPKTPAVFTANVTVGSNPVATYAKPVTLYAPKKSKKRS